ncbi:MAG: glycine cleavage system protein GcvH [Gammaproteobacteria bacterium]
MSTLKFTHDHEWLRREDDGSTTVGITDYAQEQLGDIVYVELPEAGTAVPAGSQLVVIESVKAVGEVAMPLAGRVVAVNDALADAPERVNAAPLDDGWLVRIEIDDASGLDALMDEAAYAAYIAGL